VIEHLLAAENALALGLLDQAERTYRQVLAADPRSAIAAVGLARVALERGDEAEAIRLARGALEIDPENATARRLVERLEEVARFRGDLGAGAAPGASDAGGVANVIAAVGPGASGAVAPGTAPPTPTPPAPAGVPPSRPTLARRGVLRRLFRRP
jgi:tetratricopeptide (TPR) repeat protein